jgi:tRNA(fMet)-specific endonuclease VapC
LTHVLDTNIVIASLNGNPEVLRRLGDLDLDDVILCAPVLAELEYGACLSARRQENLSKIRALASRMRFQPFGASAAQRYGELKAVLRRRGLVKSEFDLSIAAIALDLGATLVSDDHAFHDGSIADLAVENWLTR